MPVEPLHLTSPSAWLKIVSDSAPLAKLMMNGRNHQVMLGPELMGVEQRLDASGTQIDIDPLFAFPEEPDDVGPFWELTKRAHATCDFCRSKIDRPRGHWLSPWVLRYNLHNAEIGIAAYGGGESGRLKFWRDWSHWLFCDRCYEQFVRGKHA